MAPQVQIFDSAGGALDADELHWKLPPAPAGAYPLRVRSRPGETASNLDQLQTALILLAVGEALHRCRNSCHLLCWPSSPDAQYDRRSWRELPTSSGHLQEAVNRPILSVNVSCSGSSEGNAPCLRVRVENCGNGPANLRAVQLLVDGRMLALTNAGDHEKAALRLLEKQFIRDAGGYISIGDHWVGSGGSTPVFTMDLDPSVKPRDSRHLDPQAKGQGRLGLGIR